MLVKLISGAGTGFFYLFKKTPAIAQKKLALRKFDPIVNQYVIFNEAKLKFSTSAQAEAPKSKPMLIAKIFSTMWALGRVAAKPALYTAGMYATWSWFLQPYWQKIEHINSKGYAYSPEQFPRLVNGDVVLPPVVEEKIAIVPGPMVRAIVLNGAAQQPAQQPTTTRLALIRDLAPAPTDFDTLSIPYIVAKMEKEKV